MDSFLDLFDPSLENESVTSGVNDINGNVTPSPLNDYFASKGGGGNKRKGGRSYRVHHQRGSNNNNKINSNQNNTSMLLPDQLPSEPQEGNIEYKLKLVNPNHERFKRLVSQVSNIND